MWIKGNYRRNLMDMHINDSLEEYLSKIDPEEYVNALKNADIQAAMVKSKPHTGLCYWPSKIGRMHKGLKGRDFLGEMLELCHQNGISVIVYYSLIFDNWAYENHPSWRVVTADGMTFKEYRNTPCFKDGRYGIVCPNNPDYREYVKQNLQELNLNYKFEGMFLDMGFWTDICYCPHCREKYYKHIGKDMPKVINWKDAGWLEFQSLREKWLSEFVKFATNTVKEINPEVTVEHQLSMIISAWRHGSTELLVEAVDYAGGDYYGGFMQQTFINKYYKSISPNLPFIHHTSRCDPDLLYHTTTKTEEEILLHVITALVHNGAFLLVDAINPDGSICPEVYNVLMKNIYNKTKKYEKYVTGRIFNDVTIWLSTYAKFNSYDSGKRVNDISIEDNSYLTGPYKFATILRQNNIPFDVVGSKNLKGIDTKVLVLSNIALIKNDEMEAIQEYLVNGGKLYMSGVIGNIRLQELLGVECIGETEHDFTYMKPTEKGRDLFSGFGDKTPLTIPMKQQAVKIIDKDCDILATIILPYTLTHNGDFAAIHANPPGIDTDMPAIISKRLGKGRIIWTAAPIEITQPFMSRNVVYNIIKDLAGEMTFTSNAPSFVEIIGWENEGKTYLVAINQQEAAPIASMFEIYIDILIDVKKATLLETGEKLTICSAGKYTRIYLPKLELFHVIELE